MTQPYHTRTLPERSSAPFFKRSDVLGREEAPTASSSSYRRLRPCPDALKFLQWIEETIPGVVGEEASLHTLERALLLLQKEYLFRRQTTTIHQDPPAGRVGFICLPEVYHEKAAELYARQQQILRSQSFTTPSPAAAAAASSPDTKPEEPVQELYIGDGINGEPKASIPDAARNGGLLISAPSGWSKSRLLGRRICYQDAIRGIGQVVLDVKGVCIDNLCDRLLYENKAVQLKIGERLRYCRMSGQDGFVTLWPLLAKRHLNESLNTTSQRIIDLIAKTDRNLSSASIQGMNRLAPLLTSVGIVLTQLEEPLYKAFDLLDNPRNWQPRLASIARHPQVREAVAVLQSHFAMPAKQQQEQTQVLRNKLSFLRFDLVHRAMFSTQTPTIDWEEVAQKGLTVLIDLRGREPKHIRQLKLFWVWNSLLEYIEERNRTDPPLALVIDELMFFVRGTTLNTQEITQDFTELLSAHKRNANLWLTLATQEQAELPEDMLTAVLSMGNQLYGATTDDETAEYRARRFDYLDPYKVKNTEYHKGVIPLALEGGKVDQFTPRYYGVTGQNTQYMPQSEMQYVEALKYKHISKEEWFFGQTRIEGDVPRTLRRITTRNLDPGQYVNGELVSELRKRLMQRDGVKVEEILRELDESVEAAEEKSTRDEPLDENAGQEKIKPKLSDRAREALTGNRPRRAGRRRYVEPE